ncbi:MAG: peptidoglycan-binding protein [Cyanobacteria bacterium J06626_23]
MSRVPSPGLALIKQFEGCHLSAYPDPLSGGRPYTVGWGSTRRKDGTPFRLGEKITQAEADDLLQWQVEREFLPSLEQIPVWSELNENQKGALLSFAYNLGAKFYGGSNFSTITRVLRERRWDQIESALLLYRNPGTNVEAGLRRRRQAEADLFNRPTGEFPIPWVSYPDVPGSKPPPPPPVTYQLGDRLIYLADPAMQGKDVLELQKLLARTGAGITIDGVFGPLSRRSVERFQSVNGLKPDGIVGPQTLKLLKTRVLYYATPPLTGSDVAELQDLLTRQGFTLKADGVFGKRTQEAVEAFQADVGLLVDGVVGPKTRQILSARVLYLKKPNFEGPDVERLQQSIESLGLAIVIDGRFGPGTDSAVRSFQRRYGLLADGVVGPRTLTKLLTLLR